MSAVADVSEKLMNFIQQESPGGGETLTVDTELLVDWFVDSLMILNIVEFVESEFGIRFQRSGINAATFKNVQTLTEYIQAQQADG